MEKKYFAALLSIFVFLFCSKKNDKSVVATGNAVASVLMGPSSTKSQLRVNDDEDDDDKDEDDGEDEDDEEDETVYSSGSWVVTPDRVKFKITAIDFEGTRDASSENATVDTSTNCEVTYDRSKPSLAILNDCNVKVPAGTYTSLRVTYSNQYEILIDDQTNRIFTDPSAAKKMTRTRPDGGGKFVSYTPTGVGAESTAEAILPAPVRVEEGATVKGINILMDAIHMTRVAISDSGAEFDPTYKFKVIVLLGTTDAGWIAHYSAQKDLNYLPTNSGTYIDFTVLYSGTNTVTSVYSTVLSAVGGTPTVCDNSGKNNFASSAKSGDKDAGYLGIDTNKIISFAISEGTDYAKFFALFSFTEVLKIGETTSMSCQVLNGSAPPQPADGKTYASGAPTLSNPVGPYEMTLIAN